MNKQTENGNMRIKKVFSVDVGSKSFTLHIWKLEKTASGDADFSRTDVNRTWMWQTPCPCGCDYRGGDGGDTKLVGYFSGGFGKFLSKLIGRTGFTLKVHGNSTEGFEKWWKEKMGEDVPLPWSDEFAEYQIQGMREIENQLKERFGEELYNSSRGELSV